MGLPSTADLLGLRRRVSGGGADLSDAERELARLRAEFTAGALASGGPTVLLQAFHNVWHVLSAAPVDPLWYVPPLYADAELTGTLTDIVVEVVQRERGGHIAGPTTNVGHIMLGGIKGAGKTMLLRAVAIAAAVLLERMVPVTHVFTYPALDFSLVCLLANAHAAMGADAQDADVHARDAAALAAAVAGTDSYTNEGLACAVAALQHERHDVLLLLDEFQCVFGLHEHAQRNRIVVASHVRELSCMHATLSLIHI